MILKFSTKTGLPQVPAAILFYINELNEQGILFNKLYVPRGEKEAEIEVYHNTLSNDVVNTAVCMNEEMADSIFNWAISNDQTQPEAGL